MTSDGDPQKKSRTGPLPIWKRPGVFGYRASHFQGLWAISVGHGVHIPAGFKENRTVVWRLRTP